MRGGGGESPRSRLHLSRRALAPWLLGGRAHPTSAATRTQRPHPHARPSLPSLPTIMHSPRHPAPPPRAADPAAEATKWWDNHPDLPNLRTVEGGLDSLLAELAAAGDRLVVIDVYGTW